MLNFKKGLALVLAAATAFTFAPFTGFGVTANATISNSGSIATPGATTVTEATPSATDTFGGINTNLIVTDNTSYSFVNENATFVKDGTKYTADQLKWYLTTAPNSTPTNMALTSKVAVINDSGENGTVGKLNVTVANATDFANNTDGKAYVEGVYWNGAVNVIVYNQKLHVTAAAGKTIKYTASDSVKGSVINSGDATKKWSTECLKGLGLIGVNNKFLTDNYSVDTTAADIKQSGKNFTAAIAQNIVAFRAKQGYLPKFLYSLFSTAENQERANRIVMGAVQPSIKVSQLVDVEYYVTNNIKEQRMLGEMFYNLDNLITLHQRKIKYILKEVFIWIILIKRVVLKKPLSLNYRIMVGRKKLLSILQNRI